jgi:hypothetical protein
LSVTQEQPFKDNFLFRDPEEGWSTDRCRKLGRSTWLKFITLGSLLQVPAVWQQCMACWQTMIATRMPPSFERVPLPKHR